ncbi:MAG: transketolase [Alphaproteobacteria bacterium]
MAKKGGKPTGRNDATEIELLRQLERKILWLSCWTIHNANHLRPNADGLKVGGHQASSASLVSLMTALYFSILRPEDRVAVKPHASPVFHAIQYLFGNQTREQLENFRGLGGAQSYPSRTKDRDDVDFSTGSVGLGAAMTVFASQVQDYLGARDMMRDRAAGRMVALVGDAELDEGNIYECLLEGWKHGLRNCWWIIDYNRQSLDGIVREGLYDRIASLFRTFDWQVVTLKYGALQRAAFAEPGGERLKAWIDACPNSTYSALTFQGGAAWRQQLNSDLGTGGALGDLLDRRGDDELAALMADLGGHCLPTILDAMRAIDHDRPVCFIAYTIKGWGLPFAGHKDNHAGIMNPAQMENFRAEMAIRPDAEWDRFEGLIPKPETLENFIAKTPFNAVGTRRYRAAKIDVPPMPVIEGSPLSTQDGFGRILSELGRGTSPLADRILTTSPDVTVSTNLGPWVNRRGLFAKTEMADAFREREVVSAQKWEFGPDGQHIELGIAEANLFLLLGAAGLAHGLFGERLLPVGTLYDPFIARGLDQLTYARYQDARFLLVGTPSGVTLAPEGGAHQSVGTPLIGMAQDGLAAFEPAFVDELSVIMQWAFEYLQRDGDAKPDETNWLRDATGGSVYLRCSTRAIDQPKRDLSDDLRKAIIDGAYWLREPGPNCEMVVAYQGVVGPQAIAAGGMLAEDRREIGVLAVTSADRLNAGWQAAQKARMHGLRFAESHIERLLDAVPGHAAIITVHDGHPATLSWLGGVKGQRIHALGVEHFGQTGTIEGLYRHFEIDTQAIVDAADAIAAGRPVRYAVSRKAE